VQRSLFFLFGFREDLERFGNGIVYNICGRNICLLSGEVLILSTAWEMILAVFYEG